MSKQELYDEILLKLGPQDSVKIRHDWAKIKALVRLYQEVKHAFAPHHAILLSYGSQLLEKGYLTNKQMILLRTLIVEYVSELADLALLNERLEQTQKTMSFIKSNMRRFESINITV